MIELSVENLTKRHGKKQVLNDISFQAKPGRVTGLLGPNGAGKSSTLRILLGLDHPDQGQALVGGVPFAKLTDPPRTLGAVLDGSGAHRSRTGRAHLRWIATLAGVPKSRVDEVLELVGLDHVAKKRVRTYSLGMGRRLALAAAILAKPQALILDEPVNGLDPEGIRWIRLFLRSLAEAGHTVLLSSHFINEVAETVDDVVILNHGSVVTSGTLDQITGSYGTLENAYFALTENPASASYNPLLSPEQSAAGKGGHP